MNKRTISLLCLSIFIFAGCHDESNPLNIRVCDEGAKKCNGTKVVRCETGAWQEILDCNSTSCIAIQKDSELEYTCGICQNGTKRFINDKANICHNQLCSNGQWTNLDFNCTNSCNSSFEGEYTGELFQDQACGECITGEQECENTSEGTIISKCRNGHWQKQSSCSNTSCMEKVTKDSSGSDLKSYTCGECIDNSIDYRNSEDGYCQKRTCANGQWSDFKEICQFSCSDIHADNDETACGICINNTSEYYEYEDYCHYHECINGIWENDSEDIYSCTHSKDDQPNGHGECRNGYERCDGNNKQICEHGKWIDILKCLKCTEEMTGQKPSAICNIKCEEGTCSPIESSDYYGQIGYRCENDTLIIAMVIVNENVITWHTEPLFYEIV